MRESFITLAAALAVVVSAHAAEVIKPQIGEPLRNAAVTRAPDGTFYLAGTRARIKHLDMTEEQVSRLPNGEPDFQQNNGVKIWSSKNLLVWKDEGLVYDLMERKKWHDYLTHFYAMPDRPLGAEPVRGIVAPKLNVVGGKFYITVSNVGHDVRWLKADRPAGPYTDGWDSAVEGYQNPLNSSFGPGDGTFFTDADGKIYLVWGPGYLAPVSDDGKILAKGTGESLLAKVQGYPAAEWCARQFDPRGASLFLHGGKYLLTWAAYTDEAGYRRDDSFYAIADRITGPYGEPRLLIPGSGAVELFDGGEQGLMASCSVADQPVLVPIRAADGSLAAAKVELPAAVAAAKPAAAPRMLDYANSKPSGRRADEVKATGRHKLLPLFDLPIADLSICKGGDSAWYLTGTVASKNNEGADFQNNDGIYLWRSTDLDTWTPLGKVWDLEKNGGAWQKAYRIPGDNLVRKDYCRGVSSPEIHFSEGTYYLAYSMNGRGTGLLKSSSGKADGPYADLGRVTGLGEAPSLFADEGGKRYWLWGKGLQIAALGDDARLAGPASDLFLRLGETPPKMSHGQRLESWDVTGPHLFAAVNPRDKNKRREYFLTYSAVSQVNERANRDTGLAAADSLLGPYTSPVRMIPHGGQSSVFAGPDGKLCAAFCGADPGAIFRERPGIVPLEWSQVAGRDWPRRTTTDYHTDRGPWAESVPPKGLEDVGIVDAHVFHAPDGFYYFSCSPQGMPKYVADAGGLHYWRAKRLEGPWEHMGQLYTMEQMRDDPSWPAIESDKDKSWNSSKLWWEPSMAFAKGTYWISGWFGGHGWGKEVVWKKSIGLLLRSTSGKPEGPYVYHSQWSHDWQGPFVDGDAVYGRSGNSTMWRMDDELKKSDPTFTDWRGRTVPTQGYGTGCVHLISYSGQLISEDCGYQMLKVNKRFVFFGLGGHTTYDMKVFWADDIRGPYRFMGIVPGLGNCPIAQNVDGKWMTAFPQAGTSKFDNPVNKIFMYEVALDATSDKPSIWPKHDVGYLGECVYRPFGTHGDKQYTPQRKTR